MNINKYNIRCTEAVVKIASRCNINCTYCYMYNQGDETYKNQPKIMEKLTYINLFKKVKIHYLKESIPSFHFIIHGGEPLLAGKKNIFDFIKKAKYILLPEIQPTFSVQTNGILIDEEWCSIFKELNINIGISLDGPKIINDQYRIDHKGKGTYDKVVKGINILQKNDIQSGILSVININSKPLETYEHIKSLGIDNIDFLFPESNHDTLPEGIENNSLHRETPYADWLINLFDLWFEDKNKLDIRFFKFSILLLLGDNVQFDYIGRSTNDIIVIETDGGIEPVDSLKICGDSFTKINFNIMSNSISEALQAPLNKMYNLSKKIVAKQCKVCPLLEICGGGYLPHRYSSSNGFNNPSIYCADLIKLYTHIQQRVMHQFSTAQLESLGGIKIYDIESVIKEIKTGLDSISGNTYCDQENYLESFKSN